MLTSIRRFQKGILIAVTIVICIAFAWLYNKMDTGMTMGGLDVQVNGESYQPTELAEMAYLFNIAYADLGGSQFAPTPMGQFALSMLGNTGESDRTPFVLRLIILRDAARKLGIEPTPKEIQTAIESIGRFANQTGQFDINVYKNYVYENLGRYRMDASDLEQLVSDFLKFEKVRELVGSGIEPTQWEIDTVYRQRYEQFYSYEMFLDANNYSKDIDITQEEIAEYYEANKESLLTDEKRAIQFVEFMVPQPKEEEPEAEATEPEAEATEPETEATEPEAEATEPEAEATEPEAEATEPEAEATEPEAEATEPEAEATEPEAEATEPEAEASEPEAEAAEADDAAAEEEAPAEEEEEEQLPTRREVANQFNLFYTELMTAKRKDADASFAELTKASTLLDKTREMGVVVETESYEPFAASDPPEALADQPQVLQAAFSPTLNANEDLVPVDLGDKIYLMWANKIVPREPMPLEEAKPEIIKILRDKVIDERLTEAAEKAKETLEAELEAGKDIMAAAEAAGLTAKMVEPFDRLSTPEGADHASAVAIQATQLVPGEVSDAHKTLGGIVLVYVQNISLPARESELEDREQLVQSMTARAKAKAMQAWFNHEYQEAEPKLPLDPTVKGKDRNPISIETIINLSSR